MDKTETTQQSYIVVATPSLQEMHNHLLRPRNFRFAIELGLSGSGWDFQGNYVSREWLVTLIRRTDRELTNVVKALSNQLVFTHKSQANKIREINEGRVPNDGNF